MSTLGIGLVGYGSIGKVHLLGYRDIPLFYPGTIPELRLAAVCTSHTESAQKAGDEGGFEKSYHRVEELVADESVQVVDISTPNDSHSGIILAAIEAGKAVYCEKPLARTGAEARTICNKVGNRANRIGMTFNYRFVPAIMRAKSLIAEGAIGEVYGFRAEYLHTGYQDSQRPFTWRMRSDLSGGGALLDLGSHVIDLIRHLLGEFRRVQGTTRTFVPVRPVAKGSTESAQVKVDDAAWFQAELESGALGTVEVSRFSTGALDDLSLRVEGSQGALRFSLMDANWLYYFDETRRSGDRGWQRLETVQSYPGAVIPPARSILGWPRTHAENQYRFLRSLMANETPNPGLLDGLRAQLVMDAVYDSARGGGWSAVATQ